MDKSTQTLSLQTMSAVSWVVAGRILARAIDLISLLVLARVLSPADFGLIAMAMPVILIAEATMELPLAQALVRVPNPTHAMFDTAFTLGVIRGALLATVVAIAAWPMSVVYHEPRLPLILFALSLAPVLRGTVNPRMVVFMARMDFRREFILDVGSKGAALIVGVSIALATGSFWAIAAATIATPVTMNAMSYLFVPYRPRLTLSEWPLFRGMVGWNSASQLISAINWQIDRLLLARYVPQEALGRFSLANDLASVPLQTLVAPMARPLVSAFAKRQDKELLMEAYRKASNAVLMVGGPVLLGMSMLAGPVLHLAVGPEWAGSAPVLQWLAIVMMFVLPVAPMNALAMSMDRTRMITWRMLGELVLIIPLMLFGVIEAGLWGAIAARLAAAPAVMVIAMLAVRSLIGLPLRVQFATLARTFAGLAVMALVLLALRPVGFSEENLVLLALHIGGAGLAGLAGYGATILGLWLAAGRPDTVEAIALGWGLKALRRA